MASQLIRSVHSSVAGTLTGVENLWPSSKLAIPLLNSKPVDAQRKLTSPARRRLARHRRRSGAHKQFMVRIRSGVGGEQRCRLLANFTRAATSVWVRLKKGR